MVDVGNTRSRLKGQLRNPDILCLFMWTEGAETRCSWEPRFLGYLTGVEGRRVSAR